MNNPAMTIKGEQAKKQLIAAALAQFGEYGMNATTREIAAQAGQNIAAITYYFGSKEDLYLACAQWIADFIGEQFRPHAEEAERLFAQPQPDRAAIRELILRACKNMIKLLTQDDTVNLSKFISREQLSPTAAYHLVHEQVISPLHSHLTRLIAAWTGCDANDTRMILHTHALIGEILAFRLGKETIFILFELFSHVHDLIIITAECQKFTSDRHDRILESLDLSVHDTFFQIHDPFLIMSQKFQIPAYEFQHKIIDEFFFRFSLSRLLPLNSADQTVRKFIIVHNHDMMTVDKK